MLGDIAQQNERQLFEEVEVHLMGKIYSKIHRATNPTEIERNIFLLRHEINIAANHANILGWKGFANIILPEKTWGATIAESAAAGMKGRIDRTPSGTVKRPKMKKKAYLRIKVATPIAIIKNQNDNVLLINIFPFQKIFIARSCTNTV